MQDITISGYTFPDTTQKISLVVFKESEIHSVSPSIMDERTASGNLLIFFNEVKPYDYLFTIECSKVSKAILGKIFFIIEKQSVSSPLIVTTYKSFSGDQYNVFIKEIKTEKVKGNDVYDVSIVFRRLT
jgi:hypothetical protein